MRQCHWLTLAIIVLSFSLSCGDGGAKVDSSLERNAECQSPAASYSYLMAFHACDGAAADCADPRNHGIHLAASNDGASWTLLPEFLTIPGSVPDLVFYNGFLYIFHTGLDSWAKLNACLETVETGVTQINSPTDSGGFVDPSLLVSGPDLVMFYLPGVLGADPAGCETYPCVKEIHSAIADGGSPSSFTQVSGARASATLSMGVFSGPATVVAGAGGVPSAIETDDGNVWLYVTSNIDGVETIRRAISPGGVSFIPESSFSVAVDSSVSSSFTSTTNVSSPSVIKWPQDWSR